MRQRRQMALLASLTLACISPSAMAATTPGPARAPAVAKMPDVRERTVTTRTIRSKEGLEYTIFISAPQGPPPARGFPVLYVLDANAWFGVAAEIARLDELEAGPAIVVGVGYPVHTLYDDVRRTYDFTLGDPATPQPNAAAYRYGGANAFLDFVRHDLRSEVAKTYPIDSRRQSLFGHSLGGFFVLHALFTAPDAFSTFIAASPAIWTDEKRLRTEEQAFEAQPRSGAQAKVLITVGGLEQQLGQADTDLMTKMYALNPAAFGGATLEQALDSIRASQTKDRMIDNAREMSLRLKAAGVPTSFVIFDGENHRSEAPSALGRALLLALRNQP